MIFETTHSDLILVPKSYDPDTKFFIADAIKYAATPPNQPRRCILTDYFNNYNFLFFFNFLPLQPIVVVLSQPGSGL